MDIDVKDPKILRWAGAILLVVVVVPMYFMSSSYPFTWASRTVAIDGLEARHEELSRDLEKARLLVRNLERVEREYAILRDQWDVAQALLPEQNEMPNLLRKVSAAGQQSGVEFQVFRPLSPVNQGFYADNPIEVTVKGGYHQTGVFLSRLANLNRIVNVSKLRMNGTPDQEKEPSTMETDLVLTAYTLGNGTNPVNSLASAQEPGTAAAAGQTKQ
ncbi:MAG: type 4a pilus biogenesis protein PilO [Gemmatimonadales bacterium]|nr:type 4a pilus biogenesis protein PilO [Gemmatimonadales bacterium]